MTFLSLYICFAPFMFAFKYDQFGNIDEMGKQEIIWDFMAKFIEGSSLATEYKDDFYYQEMEKKVMEYVQHVMRKGKFHSSKRGENFHITIVWQQMYHGEPDEKGTKHVYKNDHTIKFTVLQVDGVKYYSQVRYFIGNLDGESDYVAVELPSELFPALIRVNCYYLDEMRKEKHIKEHEVDKINRLILYRFHDLLKEGSLMEGELGKIIPTCSYRKSPAMKRKEHEEKRREQEQISKSHRFKLTRQDEVQSNSIDK